jgi:hypothetical protein
MKSQKDRVEVPVSQIPERLEDLDRIDALSLPPDQAMAVWLRRARLTEGITDW